MGYKEGIFEGAEITPTSIPSNLVEVWCRDTNDQDGIEVITHFDRNTNEAVTRLHYAITNADLTKSNRLVPDFSVTRVLSSTTFHATAENGFDLVVQRDQPAPQFGLFLGTLKATIEGKKETRTTYCRFGGSLDPRVWPVQQVIDYNVASINESDDLKYLAYVTKDAIFSNGAQKLFILPTDFSKHLTISDQVTPSMSQLHFTSTSDRLIYMSDRGATPEIRAVKVDGSADTFLNTTQSLTGLQLSSDGSSVFYSEYDRPTPPNTVILKSVSTLDGSKTPIHPPVAPSTMGVTQVHVLDQSVAFLCSDNKTKLYTANFDGSNLKAVPLPALPTNWNYATNTFSVLNTKKLGSLWAWSPSAPLAAHNYIISLDGSWSQKLPVEWNWVSTNPTDTHGLLVHQADVNRNAVINLKSGQMLDLPAGFAGGGPFQRDGNQKLDSRFFSADSKSFIGLSKNPTSDTMDALAISAQDGTIENLCPGRHITSIQEYKLGHLLMMGYKKSSNSFDIYLKVGTSACQKVNSVPLEMSSITQIQLHLSPDEQKVLAQINGTDAGTTNHQKLFYIPLNGQPSYLINSPVFIAAKIDKAYFLKDSSTVLYYGDQIRPGQKNVFKWVAPREPQ